MPKATYLEHGALKSFMRNLSYLNKFFHRYKGRLLLGILFIILTNWFKIKLPEIVDEALDHMKNIVSHTNTMKAGEVIEIEEPRILGSVLEFFGSETGTIVSSREDLMVTVINTGILLCLLYICIALIQGFFLFMTRQTIIIMSRLIEYDLKNEIYDHYQTLSRSFYKRNNTGDLMNRISEDVSKVRQYLGPAVMYSINLVVLFIMVVVAMIQISPKLTLYALTPLPIMSIIIYFVSSIINKRSENVQRKQSDLSTFIQEAFSGVRILKAYSRLDAFGRIFAKESELYKEKQLKLVTVNALFMPTIILLIGVSTLLSIYVGGDMIINGEDDLSLSNMVAFVFYVNMLTWPFAAIGWVTSLVQRASASQARINEFLNQNSEVVSGNQSIEEFRNGVTFENVDFIYPDSGILALKGFNYHLTKGSSLALFGKTGSGKTTVAELLCRHYDPSQGVIRIDGAPLTDLDLSDYRSLIGYVPQDVFLFSDTIFNNVAFGCEGEADRADVEKATETAHLKHNIDQFKDGYETVLGEWGISLSGGQKQRLSIARALIRYPQLLIFDDSLSALDTETEDRILSGLDKVMGENITTILISHRVSTVARAKHIIVLEEGVMTDQGTHEELLSRDGFYSQMHRKQSLEALVN